ncbi:hypothetical protein [Streptomyces sp. CB00455]|uniref:hypothetical protein n=1 Tax=Streptomyces sp. CB00455 TaxID=1703927 RepID=UPI000ADBB6B6
MKPTADGHGPADPAQPPRCRTGVVTGAARGLGASPARELARRGMRVAPLGLEATA